MNTVSRKRKKPFPRKLKIVLILVSVLVLIGIWQLSRPQPLPEVEPRPDRIVLSSFNLEDIEKIILYPTGGEPFTLLRNADNSYAIAGDEGFRLNTARVEEIFDMATLIRADYLAQENTDMEHLSEFGITNDSFHFTIHAKDGVLETWFAAENVHADDTHRFLFREGDTAVYLTELDYISAMNFTKEELHPIPDINYTPDLIDGIDVRYASGDEVSLTNEQGIWYVKKPFRYPASGLMQDLLEKAGRMRLSTYVAEGNEKNLRLYGLHKPFAVVTIRMAASIISVMTPDHQVAEQRDVPEHEITFYFGDAFASVGYYCLFDDMIYKATMLSMGFLLNIEPDILALQTPFDIPLNKMQWIAVMREEQRTDYYVEFAERVLPNNLIAVDDSGNTIYDMYVKRNGDEILAEPFMRAYLDMMSLSSSGEMTENSLQTDAALLTVFLKYDSGERTIAFYPYDALHAAIAIDGVVRHYVTLSQLDLITI